MYVSLSLSLSLSVCVCERESICVCICVLVCTNTYIYIYIQGQLDAVVKGLKKTTLFSGSMALAGGGESGSGKTKLSDVSSADAAKEAALEVKSREFVPGVPFSKESAVGNEEGGGGSLASYSKALNQTIPY